MKLKTSIESLFDAFEIHTISDRTPYMDGTLITGCKNTDEETPHHKQMYIWYLRNVDFWSAHTGIANLLVSHPNKEQTAILTEVAKALGSVKMNATYLNIQSYPEIGITVCILLKMKTTWWGRVNTTLQVLVGGAGCRLDMEKVMYVQDMPRVTLPKASGGCIVM